MRNTENDPKAEKTVEENDIIQQKLTAFEVMRDDFVASFRFLEDVRCQRELQSLALRDGVRYLHAIWIDERKSCVLSVAKTVKQYDGETCLNILRDIQNGEAAPFIAFLNDHLHLQTGSQEQQQLHVEAQADSDSQRRVEHGYRVLTNYNANLSHLLDAVNGLSKETLAAQSTEACRQYGHSPEQIVQQLEEMNSPLYSFVPGQELAQQNMLVMNLVATDVVTVPGDVPGKRTNVAVPSTEPDAPLAEEVIKGYEELASPNHNNINHDTFVDQPEQEENGDNV